MRGYCAVALTHGKLNIPQHSYRNPAAMEAMCATDNNYCPITLDLLRVSGNYNNDHHYKIRASNQNAARYARPSWIPPFNIYRSKCKWRRANKKLETET